MCVENKMTNHGPMWAKVFLGHHARILPISNPFVHACWAGRKNLLEVGSKNRYQRRNYLNLQTA